MVMHCVYESDPAVRIKKMSIKTDNRGYRISITIDVPFGTQLTGKLHKMQQYVIENIESYTGILIEEVSFIIDKITGTEYIDEKPPRIVRQQALILRFWVSLIRDFCRQVFHHSCFPAFSHPKVLYKEF